MNKQQGAVCMRRWVSVPMPLHPSIEPLQLAKPIDFIVRVSAA
ncbi:MAG TPA: hypothetical protein VFZ09_21245 [Archangium sp.]|nr:hypothetical protein [Archangium sp.]HEX5748781.1 hypothetical protein [Archangium sp.]